jgi:hypothetical protein
VALASVEVDGQLLEVVDMHLHPGQWAQMNPDGKEFITAAIPIFLRGYAPAILGHATDPYAPHVGIHAETDNAGVDHAVLYSVFTHHTTGYFTNVQLHDALVDERNDGWAWGFVSLNLDDLDPESLQPRLDAMRSYLDARPDLFIGIKLAHAHQAVAIDDAAAFGTYEVAASTGVPVLLHTGFSPLPNALSEPEYYDPAFLEDVITTYDGTGPDARVDFVLSHVGQGDARAVESALSLAETHDNVWLELSALARPTLIDLAGQPVVDGDDQYPYVLEQVLARGLVSRTLFASDGPQLSGTIRSYLERMVIGMLDAGFSTADIGQVLSGNFYTLYFDGSPP